MRCQERATSLCAGALALVASLCCSGDAGAGVDLSHRYPGGERVAAASDSDWPLAPGDAWSLDGFHFQRGDGLGIDLGPSRVVFGVRGKAADAGAVWAVVLPDEPAPLATTHPGAGEHVKSLLVRFHPTQLGELFPAESVRGPAPPDVLVPVRWIYQHRIAPDWRSAEGSELPPREAFVFDVDTVEGTRRVYAVDTEGAVRWERGFGDRGLPEPPGEVMNRIQALEAFDVAWNAVDAGYPLFGLRPEVDWDALRRVYRPVAARARTRYEVAGSIALMLDPLLDRHIFVRVGSEILAGFDVAQPPNGSWPATTSAVRDLRQTGRDINWGWLEDDIGYIEVRSLAEARENRGGGGRRQFTKAFDQALEELAETRGLVLDLRFNWGGIRNLGVGDVNMALRVSGRFMDRERVYGGNRERDRLAHGAYRTTRERERVARDALTAIEPLSVVPRLWRYQAPVAVLIGPRTSGMAESLALMLAQNPAATLVGEPTAGVGGTRLLVRPLGQDLSVAYPVALHTDPQRRPVDGAGVAPDLRVELPAGALRDGRDPVLAAALELVRKRAD